MKSIRAVLKKAIRLPLIGSKPVDHHQLHLTGPFSSYDSALSSSSGYSSPQIISKVKTALIDVISGNAVYERDGTSFVSFPHNLKIHDILSIYLRPDSSIVDFGGGLGGFYLNHRSLFSSSNSYTIIEQPLFVSEGIEFAKTHALPISFCNTLANITGYPDILIMSSVLPYLPDPYAIIDEAIRLKPSYIIVDRTAVIEAGENKWWVQEEATYYGVPVSYPIQPLHQGKLLNRFSGYELIEEWINPFDALSPLHKGFLLKRSSH